MFREERLKQILEKLLVNKKISVDDLSAEFKLSSSSIRNDLTELESRGLLTRTYGGAILPDLLDTHLMIKKNLFQMRMETHRAEKDAIGQAVAELIEDGETIMLDGGSTTAFVARHLAEKKRLTIVTIATNLVPNLMAIADADVYITGGMIRRSDQITIGEITLDALGRFHTNTGILGTDGISLQYGLTATDASISAIKRKIMGACKRIIVCCDHSKLDQVCLLPVAPVENIDILVTDDQVPMEIIEAIRARGPKVIVVPVKQQDE